MGFDPSDDRVRIEAYCDFYNCSSNVINAFFYVLFEKVLFIVNSLQFICIDLIIEIMPKYKNINISIQIQW